MNDASLLTQAALLQESRVVIVIAGMAGAALIEIGRASCRERV